MNKFLAILALALASPLVAAQRADVNADGAIDRTDLDALKKAFYSAAW